MGRHKPGKVRRRRPDELPDNIQIRETRPGEGKAFTDLAALAMEGHGDFDDRESMCEVIDEGGPFTSKFGAGRVVFLVAEHTPTGPQGSARPARRACGNTGLPLDITGWTQDEIDTGVALMTELGQFGPGGRAMYDPRPGHPHRFHWSGDTP
ncbi:hypothetical protein ACWD4K_34285 [Streptomyces gelaticus]